MPAGRPKGSTSKAKKVEEKIEKEEFVESPKQEIDMQELIAKAVAMALEQSEEKHKKEIDDLKRKQSYNANDVQVEVMNNINGIFIIGGKKGKMVSIYVKMDEYGKTAFLTFDEIRAYNSQSGKVFRSGELIIKDVFGFMELEDLVKKLGLHDLYCGDVDISDFNTIFELDYNVFEEFLNKNENLIEIALEHALKEHKNGKFNYGDKQNYFRNKLGNNELFTK